MAEEVHEERPVEVLAHLVENKPAGARLAGPSIQVVGSPVAKFCGFDKSLDRLNFRRLLEVLMKSHREEMVAQPRGPGI